MSPAARSSSTPSQQRSSAARPLTPSWRRFGRGLCWTTLAITLVLTAAFAGWRVLAAADFGYPVAYKLLDIEDTIATYGPQNELRPGFDTTSEDERARIFGAIAAAVRADGMGLDSIRYSLPGGRTLPVLTAPEIQHLQDVAALVSAFERVGWTAAALAAALLGLAWSRRWLAPSTGRFTRGVSAGAFAVSLAVLALGPVRTFYWLHEQVFPPEHEWFFWYQESLMSMLMQAPNLFGVIAVAWLVLTLVLAVGAWAGAARLLARRAS